jgi:hypothetical protein
MSLLLLLDFSLLNFLRALMLRLLPRSNTTLLRCQPLLCRCLACNTARRCNGGCNRIFIARHNSSWHSNGGCSEGLDLFALTE